MKSPTVSPVLLYFGVAFMLIGYDKGSEPDGVWWALGMNGLALLLFVAAVNQPADKK